VILNTYAILDGCVALLRLGLAAVVVAGALPIWRRWRTADLEDRNHLESRGYLLFMMASFLVVLNIASWPLLYMLLESYVPEWPGVMCIYGVTQVGVGSVGMSRFLPGLLLTLQLLKPLLIFAGGVWAMLYLAHRNTAGSPLMRRVLLGLIGMGMLAALDAAAEIAYLLIPKKEEALAVGCCMDPPWDADTRFLPTPIVGNQGRSWLIGAWCAVGACLSARLLGVVRSIASRPRIPNLTLLWFGAGLFLFLHVFFVIDVLAPTLLHLPHHHCPYDLVARAPESLLGVAAVVLGSFAVGWSWLATWLAACPETRSFLGEGVRRLLVFGFFCYLGGMTMLVIELILT
jgi:hypothetical protein